MRSSATRRRWCSRCRSVAASSRPAAWATSLVQVADVPAGFLGAAEDALHVHLGAEHDGVRGVRQVLRVGGVVPGRQRLPGVGVDETLHPVVPPRHPGPRVADDIVVGPPHLLANEIEPDVRTQLTHPERPSPDLEKWPTRRTTGPAGTSSRRKEIATLNPLRIKSRAYLQFEQLLETCRLLDQS